MKQIYISAIAMALLMATASWCNVSAQTNKQLMKLSTADHDLSFTYNDQGQLTGSRWIMDGGESTRVSSFEYRTGEIVQRYAEGDDDTTPDTRTATVENGRITREHIDGGTWEVDFTYTYNADNQLTEMAIIEKGKLYEKIELVWTDGNITSVKTYNNQGELKETYTYTYNTEVCNLPAYFLFASPLLGSTTIDYEGVIPIGMGMGGYYGAVCRNVPATRRYQSVGGNPEWDADLAYDYTYRTDASGLITEFTATGGGEAPVTATLQWSLPTAVSAAETTPSQSVWYNLKGEQLAQPTPGINIIKFSDGTVRKVMRR